MQIYPYTPKGSLVMVHVGKLSTGESVELEVML